MKRHRFTPFWLLLGALGLLVSMNAAPASAQTTWYPASTAGDSFYLHNASIAVASEAQVKNGGFSIEEKIQFTCPKGKTYAVTGTMAELNPPRYTFLQVDGDGGINAVLVGHPTGKCTGKPQVLKLRFNVIPTSGWDAGCTNSFPETICWDANPGGMLPIEPNQGSGEIDVRIAGDDFYAEYVAYAASCCSNGRSVTLV